MKSTRNEPESVEDAGAAGSVWSRLGSALLDPGRPLLAVLWTVAVLVSLAVALIRLSDPTLPGMPWQDPHHLADFRDTIWAPGQAVLSGGNPYDSPAYVTAYPWAQDFKLYAPAWLLLSVSLAWLPFLAAAAIYLVLGIVLAVVLIRLVLKWAAPEVLLAGTPILLIFFNLWSPTRYALQNGGTLLVMIGSILVVQSIIRHRPGAPEGPDDPTRGMAALGVALSLVKPQFGLPLVVFALVGRRFDAVWRGVVGLFLASLPALVACTVAAGGPSGFVDSVLRNLAYSNSPSASTGLASEFNERIDLEGILARFGFVDLPGPVALAIPVLAILIGAWIVARRPSPIMVATGVSVCVLFCVVHQPYDMVLFLLPAAIGLGRVLAGRPPAGLDLVVWIAALVPVLHMHGVTLVVVPGLTRLAADTVDVVALLVAVLLCAWAGLRRPAEAPVTV